MNTQILTTTDTDIARAAALLKGGGLVAFPTETVYGIGANALDGDAVQKIFAAKGRPSDNPLIVHIADAAQLAPLVREIPENAQKLMDAFWPGPLTIVMKKSSLIPEFVSAGLDTVGIRIPKSETALRLLRACAMPVAAPSANTSGKPSPTNAKRVSDDLSGRIDAIIDGGSCDVGVESTVIDCSTAVPHLLRPGGVTYEQLTEVLGTVVQSFGGHSEGQTPKSPGMKYKHYAPSAQVVVVTDDFEGYVLKNAPKYQKAGVITRSLGAFPVNCEVRLFGSSPKEYAANLFEHLRSLDDAGAEIIFAEDIDCKGLNLATRNRLHRAAGLNSVKE